MLKTNSKKARQNIQEWILKNYNEEGYDFDTPATTFQEKSKRILEVFHHEKMHGYNLNQPEFEVFREWAQGLAGILNTADYYYFNYAKDVLGEILEESQEEKARYKENQAQQCMDYLLFREIKKAASM